VDSFAVALGKSAHQVDQVGALHAERAEVCDGLAELGTLVLDRLLQTGKATDGLFWGRGQAAAQDVELDFDA